MCFSPYFYAGELKIYQKKVNLATYHNKAGVHMSTNNRDNQIVDISHMGEHAKLVENVM